MTMFPQAISDRFGPERKFKWSEKKTYDFVNELSKTQCIWNSTHPQYKHKNEREAAFASLGRAFDCTPSQVRKKIKGLRGTYIQELHKIEDSKNNRDGNYYKPRLIWFDLMDSFLNEQVKSERLLRASSTFQHLIKVESADSDELNVDPLEGAPTDDFPDEKLVEWNSVDSSELLMHSSLAQQQQQRSSSPNHQQADQNAFDIFGRSVAQQLKEFTSVAAALRAQAKIQCLLTEERIRDLAPSDKED